MPQGPEFIRCDYPNPLPITSLGRQVLMRGAGHRASIGFHIAIDLIITPVSKRTLACVKS